jgi:hypothetical protein
MCKAGRDEFGQTHRCEEDTSEARQLRRMKARTIERNKDNISASFNSVDPVTPIINSPSLETIIESINNLDDLEKSQESLNNLRPNPANMYVVEVLGEKVRGSKSTIAKKIIAEREVATVKVGAEINGLVDAKTGITDKELLLEYTSRATATIDHFTNIVADYRFAEKHMTSLLHPISGIMKELDHKVAITRDKLKDDPEKLNEFNNAYQSYLGHKEYVDATRPVLAQDIDYGDAELREKLTQRIVATKDILAEIRPMGGKVNIHDSSHKNKIGVLQEAAAVYPQAWIDRSNESEAPRIKYTGSRAHYQAKAQQTIMVDQQIFIDQIKPEDWVPNPRSSHDYGIIPVDSETHTYIHPETGETVELVAAEGYKAWVSPMYDHFNESEHEIKILKDGTVKPRGHGWKEVEFDFVIHDYTTNTNKSYTQKTWVKPAITKKARTFTVPELTISDEKTPYHTASGYRIAVHEFAHRMEHVGSADIKIMEEQFLARRTTVLKESDKN